MDVRLPGFMSRDRTSVPKTGHGERIPYAGCVRPISDEFARWQDATGNNIRLVTLSPHWPEAAGYISAVTKAGVVASIGHTGANAQQIARRLMPVRRYPRISATRHTGCFRNFPIACGISLRKTA